MGFVDVVCPNPACLGRIVEGESVARETWEATWYEPFLAPRSGELVPGEWGPGNHCPRCGMEGVDPESGQLDEHEEELGVRCNGCGVVTDPAKWHVITEKGSQSPGPWCPHCGDEMPKQGLGR